MNTMTDERPPARVGDGEAVPDAQGQLPFRYGRARPTPGPRIFAKPGETTLSASFRIGRTRFSGPTPYDDDGSAHAFAVGAVAVAAAVHDRFGPGAVALALGGKVGILRFGAEPVRSGRRSIVATAAHRHSALTDEAWVAWSVKVPDADES